MKTIDRGGSNTSDKQTWENRRPPRPSAVRKAEARKAKKRACGAKRTNCEAQPIVMDAELEALIQRTFGIPEGVGIRLQFSIAPDAFDSFKNEEGKESPPPVDIPQEA